MEVKLRKTSIDVVGDVPWGTHFCQFYQTKEDLIDILVPYFKAGLENNEFCMWITAEPLNAEEAHKALKKKVRSLDDYIKKGQIEIIDYNQLYTKQGNFDSEEVLQGWVEKEQNALKKGFDGFRFTGNICWLKKSDWEKFANYEEAANSVIARYRMLAVCSYCLDNCSSSEIIDVVSNHQLAIIKRENEWKTIRSSDRKKADEARQKSEHRYRTLVEANPYGIQEIDTSGNITYTNPAYQKMLGYSEQELLGISILDLLETESKRDELRDYLSILVKEQPQPTTYYQKNLTKDNRIIDIMVDWNYKRDNEGRVVGFTSVITDITERKKAQEELKRSKEFITNIINTLDDPFFVKDQEHRWFMLNDAACKVMGRPREELIGKSDYDLFPKEQADRFWERDSFVLENGQTDLNEEEITWHGKLHTISTKKSLFTDSLTGQKFITGTIRDITEFKTTEEALQESEERLRFAVQAAQLCTWDWNLLTDEVWLGGYITEVLGLDSEVKSIPVSAFMERVNPDDFEHVQQAVERAINERTLYKKEYRIVRPDGTERWIAAQGQVVYDKTGKAVRMIGVNQDITERKHLEEAYRSLVDNSLQGLAIVQDGRMVFLNKAFSSTTGYSREDLLASSPEQVQSMVHPDDRELIWARHRDRIAGKAVPARYEFRWIRKDGSTCWVEIYASRIEYQGRPAIQATYVDITERKKAEEALFKEKKFTEDAINAQIDTFFLFDSGTGKAIRWNKAFTDISGYTDGEIARTPAPSSYYSPEDSERAVAFIQKVLKEGVGTIELELICKDGRKVPTEYRVSIINDDQGEPKYIISIGRDITERKLAEEELKLHKIRLQALLDLNKMTGTSEQNILDFVREEVIKVTQSQFAFIGFMNDDESVMTTENFSKNTMAQCAVADKPMRFTIANAGLWGEAVRQRKPVIVNDYNAPHPMKRGFPRGHVPIERFLGIPVFDGGHIVVVAGVANKANDYDESDIRAIESMMNDTWRLLRRKRAEEALQKSEANYRAIFDNANDAIFVHDIDNAKILSANKKACQMYGYTQKEFEKLSVEDISTGVPPYTQKDGLRWFKKAADEGSQLVEWICKDKTGRNFWVEVNLRLAVIEGRKRMFAIVRDITERKDIEAQQKLSGQILECLNRKSVGANLIRDILKLVKKATGLEAVGLRQQRDGDFPYFEVNGFPEDFLKAENYLCTRNETGELILDSKGRPILECMCGIVLSGRADPTSPFFTEGGSFWTNSTSELLTCTPQEDFQVPTRNRFNEAGYESVALIPLRSGDEIVGLLQLNDTRKGCFNPEMVRFFEEIGASIGIGLTRIRVEQEVKNLAKFPSENPYPILRIAKDSMIIYANAAGSELLDSWGCKVGEQAPEHWHEHILKIFTSGLSEQLEVVCEDRIFSLVMTPVVDAGYANVYGSDITERKHAEESLRKYQQQLEKLVQIRTAELTETNKKLLKEIEGRKRLEKQILNISEREQKRIGQELHDSIGQQFTGIAFMTKVLEQKLTEKLAEEATDAAEIKKLVNQAMDQARSLARGLHPVDLDACSLTSALQELAATTENLFGIRCTFKCDKSILIDDAEVATHLYRITQEAITNAIKHGKAKNIRVELAHERDKSVLKVKNDGLHFPEEFEARGTGMGLQIMDHRADIIGASLDIHKAAEGGTILTCSFSNKTD